MKYDINEALRSSAIFGCVILLIILLLTTVKYVFFVMVAGLLFITVGAIAMLLVCVGVATYMRIIDKKKSWKDNFCEILETFIY